MIGEIKLLSFDFAPQGWALCNGALLSIAQNQTLFALLGTKYGGNGVTDFALPNLPGVQNSGSAAVVNYYIALQAQ